MNFYKLILLDLDGTALMSDRIHMSERLLRALACIHEMGVHILPITGRPFSCLPPIFREELAWKDLCIVNGGSEYVRFCDGAVLENASLSAEVTQRILSIAEAYQTPIEVNAAGKIYLTETDEERLRAFGVPALTYHLQNQLPAYGQHVEDLKKTVKDGRISVSKLTMPYVPIPCRSALFDTICRERVHAVWGSENGMEVTSLAATKGHGLRWACEYYGITSDECIAFGDSGNDVSMLREAGLGVAMGNAPEAVKAAADIVTYSNDEDGVAYILEQKFLQV